MVTTVQLLTPHEVFTRLRRLAEGQATTVKVDREELSQLLTDHSVLCSALSRSTSFKLVEPTRRERPKLKGS